VRQPSEKDWSCASKTTGRYIPEALATSALQAMKDSVPRLSELVDFHASIVNEDGEAPRLETVMMHNTSGDWELLKKLSNPHAYVSEA